MVASGSRLRPASLLALVCVFALALCAVLLFGYRALDEAELLPSGVPSDQKRVAESRLVRDAGSGDTPESKKTLKADAQQLSGVIKDNPNYAPAYYFRAVAYQRLGENKLAMDDYSQALELDKKVESMSSAQQNSLHAVSLRSDLAEAHCNLAALRFEIGNPSAAIDDYTAALAIDDGYAEAFCGRGEAFLKIDEPRQAILDLNEALRLTPNWLHAQALLARARVAADDYSQGLADARRAVQLDPQSADAKYALALALAASPDESRDATEEHLDKDLLRRAAAEELRALLDEGVRLTKAGRPWDAKQAFDGAERLDPALVASDREYRARNHPAPAGPPQVVSPSAQSAALPVSLPPRLAELSRRPFAALSQNEFNEIVRAFARIGPIDPDCRDPWVWCGRGAAFLDKNDPVSAIGDFSQAIYSAASFAQAYCLRGRANMMLGDWFHAELDLTAAIRLKPDDALAYLYRAEAFSRDKSWDRAVADLAQAAALDRKANPSETFRRQAEDLYVEICRGRARADIADGRLQAAEDSLASIENPHIDVRVSTRVPPLAQDYADLGVKALKANDWSAAIGGFEKAKQLDKEKAKEIDPQLAVAHAERGYDLSGRRQFRAAVADLDAALRLDPHRAENWRLAGLASAMLARDSQDRARPADARLQWQDAVVQLRRAIRIKPDLKYTLEPALDEAQRNSTLLVAQPQATLVR